MRRRFLPASALWLSFAVLLTAGCGGGAERSTPSGQGGNQPEAADPVIRLAVAVVALERSRENALTPQQAAKMLPWLKVLKTMRPDDTEADRAITDEAFAILTAEQRAALERMRERARDRSGPGSPGGPGGPGAAAPGGPGGPPGGQGTARRGSPGRGPGAGANDPALRSEFRTRALDRAIQLLEEKVTTSQFLLSDRVPRNSV